MTRRRVVPGTDPAYDRALRALDRELVEAYRLISQLEDKLLAARRDKESAMDRAHRADRELARLRKRLVMPMGGGRVAAR